MHPLQRLEQALRIARVEADAVVAQPQQHLAGRLVAPGAQGNRRHVARRAELDRVVEQPSKRDPQQHPVAAHHRQRPDRPLGALHQRVVATLVEQFGNQRAEIDRPRYQRQAFDLRQRKQVAGQPVHPVGGTQDGLDVALAVGVEPAGRFGQQLGKAANVAERCAQLAGRRADEVLERGVGLFEKADPLGHGSVIGRPVGHASGIARAGHGFLDEVRLAAHRWRAPGGGGGGGTAGRGRGRAAYNGFMAAHRFGAHKATPVAGRWMREIGHPGLGIWRRRQPGRRRARRGTCVYVFPGANRLPSIGPPPPLAPDAPHL